MSTKKKTEPEVLGFLGVGLDNQDGHHRLTKTEHFLLVGGSEDTHESMQEIAIKFDESLDKRGKKLREISVAEVIDLLHGAADR